MNSRANNLPRFLARWATGLIVAAAVISSAGELRAGDWMYRRSYYSHERPQQGEIDYPRPRSRSAYRPAVPGRPFGAAIRGGYRFNRIFLRSGQSTDVTVIYEGWFGATP